MSYRDFIKKTPDRRPVSPFESCAPAPAPAGGAAAGGPDAARPHDAAPLEDDGFDAVLGRLRQVIDNRVIALAVLVPLVFVLLRSEGLPLLVAVLFGGYVLCDRFIPVRRCVTIGGSIWLAVLLVGNAVMASLGYLLVTLDYLFTFCGFLLALAACLALFAGRSMYHHGIDRGRADADAAIAEHVVNRLVENPDDWTRLDGDFLAVEGALARVRDRERASAQALRDEARRKDDLVTYLAHDIKTPLASVIGYLSLLEEAPELPLEQRARFTGIALDKARRLDALIEEFFDITRFDFHDIVLTRGYVNLSLMLSQVAEEFYPTVSSQGKAIEVDAPADLTALIDGDKMARVFNNVIKNAIAYSYEGSVIRLRAVRADGMVRVTVENQGDPIPGPKLKLIFEKFYRLDAARATNHGGAGLGLAIAKEIVGAHGGAIACDSTPERTVFTIDLPDEGRPAA